MGATQNVQAGEVSPPMTIEGLVGGFWMPLSPPAGPSFCVERKSMKVKVLFAWYDIWVGIFIDKPNKRMYIFPIPMIGVRIDL